MPTWLPFRALRYNTHRISNLADVITPPYDVIDAKAQAAYEQKSLYNSIRLILGRSQPDEGPGGWYARAARYLDNWQGMGILRRDPEPALYILRQTFTPPGAQFADRFTRIGIIARLKLAPWGSGILPHERTFPNAKADRLALTEATQAQYNPIFTLFSDPENQVMSPLQRLLEAEPAVSWQADGVNNEMWVVSDPGTVSAVTSALDARTLYVADGHHRYETALNYQRIRRQAEGSAALDDAPYDYVLAYATPMEDPGVVILPTHRVVRNVAAFDAQRLVDALYQRFTIVPYQSAGQMQNALKQAPAGEYRFGLVLADRPETALLLLKPDQTQITEGTADDPAVAVLDVAVLQRLILTPLLSIPADPQAQKAFLFFSPDPNEVIQAVQRGEYQAAFLINPTPIQALATVAEAGQVMPPKSTYFYPKLPSALVIHSLT